MEGHFKGNITSEVSAFCSMVSSDFSVVAFSVGGSVGGSSGAFSVGGSVGGSSGVLSEIVSSGFSVVTFS